MVPTIYLYLPFKLRWKLYANIKIKKIIPVNFIVSPNPIDLCWIGYNWHKTSCITDNPII
jgi:hypothetical protein